jgi:hypothetical protein
MSGINNVGFRTMSALREQCYCAQRMLNEAKHCFLYCEDYVQCYGHCMGKKKGGTMSTFKIVLSP